MCSPVHTCGWSDTNNRTPEHPPPLPAHRVRGRQSRPPSSSRQGRKPPTPTATAQVRDHLPGCWSGGSARCHRRSLRRFPRCRCGRRRRRCASRDTECIEHLGQVHLVLFSLRLTQQTPDTPFGRGSRPGAFCTHQPRPSSHTLTVDGRCITMTASEANLPPWSPLRFSTRLQGTASSVVQGWLHYIRTACKSQCLRSPIDPVSAPDPRVPTDAHPVRQRSLRLS